MEEYFTVGREFLAFGKPESLRPRTIDHPETEWVEPGEESFIHFNRLGGENLLIPNPRDIPGLVAHGDDQFRSRFPVLGPQVVPRPGAVLPPREEAAVLGAVRAALVAAIAQRSAAGATRVVVALSGGRDSIVPNFAKSTLGQGRRLSEPPPPMAPPPPPGPNKSWACARLLTRSLARPDP